MEHDQWPMTNRLTSFISDCGAVLLTSVLVLIVSCTFSYRILIKHEHTHFHGTRDNSLELTSLRLSTSRSLHLAL